MVILISMICLCVTSLYVYKIVKKNELLEFKNDINKAI